MGSGLNFTGELLLSTLPLFLPILAILRQFYALFVVHSAVVYYNCQISGTHPTFSPPWHLGLPPCTHLLALVKLTIILFRPIDDNFLWSLCCSHEICWLAPATNVQNIIFFLEALLYETRHSVDSLLRGDWAGDSYVNQLYGSQPNYCQLLT